MLSITQLRSISWKRFIIGTFDKNNILIGIFNFLTLALVAIVITIISSWFTSEQQFTTPIWLCVVGGVSIVFALFATLAHSLASLIVFMILNAVLLGYFVFNLWESNSNTLGILFSFTAMAQFKAIEFLAPFWMELREETVSVGGAGAGNNNGTHTIVDDDDLEDHHKLNDDEDV